MAQWLAFLPHSKGVMFAACVWGRVGVPPQSQNMHVRLIGDTKLARGVCVFVMCVPCDRLEAFCAVIG